MMEEKHEDAELETCDADSLVERETLCLPHFGRGTIVNAGNAGYTDMLAQYFPTAESNATERLVNLKAQLRVVSTHEFWRILMEEMCDITGSQCGLVAKRMLPDDQDNAMAMPELGEPDSCLLGVAFYINCQEVRELYRDYRYHAYGTPCAHMKHEKVCIIPERMPEFIPNSPNTMPWKVSEAFIGVPLFMDGKCFAHFALVFSSEGASKRKVSWNFIEMFMHSLEDMIVQRIIEGRSFMEELTPAKSVVNQILPLESTATTQSLKPHARSLSHELRTPMQGIVGMLDIMYSTVLDAIATSKNELLRSVFDDLKSNIEVVHGKHLGSSVTLTSTHTFTDSSKRAVEAADNVVHAYDLNMQMPDTPLSPTNMAVFPSIEATDAHKHRPVKHTRNLSSPTGGKRARDDEPDFHPGPPSKRMFAKSYLHLSAADMNTDSSPASFELSRYVLDEKLAMARLTPEVLTQSKMLPAGQNHSYLMDPVITPRRRVNIRLFLQTLVSETIRNGHPIREAHTPTNLGETIEFECRSSKGDLQLRTIHLSAAQNVPEKFVMDEHNLQFSLQKLVDNAIKFTDCGTINIHMKMSIDAHILEIWVGDSGCGINPESQKHLFEPHFQQDSSISRARDGLGLSLFNAKAQVRKTFGGDITLERSSTQEPQRGSEFLVRLPVAIKEVNGEEVYSMGPSTPRQRSRRPSPHPLMSNKPSLSESNLTESTSISVTMALRGPAMTSRKRAGFNPNLAEAYPLNFLIAEDNAINRKVAVTSLKKLGYCDDNITVAFDGIEAVRKFEASFCRPTQPRYNAILMDIWMPNVDGYEASQRILKTAEAMGETTTIMAVTADITEQCVERAKAAGMQGFLAKPYKLLDIERLIVDNFPPPTNGMI